MSQAPRIVSLLPAATELACALHLENQLVGISSECNYPREITQLPRVVHAGFETHNLLPDEIDNTVRKRVQLGQSLYMIDEDRLAALRPDIILTQDLCQVCAPSGSELSQVLKRWDLRPQVIYFSPHSLTDIMHGLMELAAATGNQRLADKLVSDWRRRRDAVQKSTAQRGQRPRVFVMEWVKPVYCAGHWLAEMIDIAGGEDIFARPKRDSVRVEWQQVVNWQPEVMVVAPCGYNQLQATAQLPILEKLPGWHTLPAVKHDRVYPVDADAYFVRPGPRVFDGLEILSDLFKLV